MNIVHKYKEDQPSAKPFSFFYSTKYTTYIIFYYIFSELIAFKNIIVFYFFE